MIHHINIILAILLCYIGLSLFHTGWDFHYNQPVPKFLGLVILFIGIGVFMYEIRALKK